MAQLTGNAIQSSYLGLLKTLDNAAMANAGFPQITDGAGNNSMLKMSQTELQLGSNINTQYIKQYANSGGITEIKDAAFSIYDATSSQYVIVDATNAGLGSGSNYFLSTASGSSVGGPLDLSGATVTGLPAAEVDVPNIANGEMTRQINGYDAATYWSACTLTASRPQVNQPAIDQGGDTMLLAPFNIDSRFTVTTLGIPMGVIANDTFEIAFFELDETDGGPGVRVFTQSASVTTADNNTWYSMTLSTPWTPTIGKRYWIGAFSSLGASNGCGFGYVSGEGDIFQRFSTTNNSSVGTIVPQNTLYYDTGGTMPTDLSGVTMDGSRDERVFYAWK